MFPKNPSRNRIYRQDGAPNHLNNKPKTGNEKPNKVQNYLSHQPKTNAKPDQIRKTGNTKIQNKTTERKLVNFDKRIGSTQGRYQTRVVQQGQVSFIQQNQQYNSTKTNNLSKDGLAGSQLIPAQGQIQTLAAGKSGISNTQNSVSSKLIGSRYEKKSRNLSESNINTLLSPASNYALKSTAISQIMNQNKNTPKSHTPLRPELNTQKLHNQLYGMPSYSKSPITTGDKIVIISDKKKRQGNFDQVTGQPLNKFGSTLQNGQRIQGKVLNYMGAHQNNQSMRQINNQQLATGSVNRVSTKRIEFSGPNNAIRGSNMEIQDPKVSCFLD